MSYPRRQRSFWARIKLSEYLHILLCVFTLLHFSCRALSDTLLTVFWHFCHCIFKFKRAYCRIKLSALFMQSTLITRLRFRQAGNENTVIIIFVNTFGNYFVKKSDGVLTNHGRDLVRPTFLSSCRCSYGGESIIHASSQPNRHECNSSFFTKTPYATTSHRGRPTARPASPVKNFPTEAHCGSWVKFSTSS